MLSAQGLQFLGLNGGLIGSCVKPPPLRLHIATSELWLPDRNALPFGGVPATKPLQRVEPSPMRNLLIVPILLIVAAAGCQSMRRMEVWKQQTFFSPPMAAQSLDGPTVDPGVSPVAPMSPLESPPPLASPMSVEALMPVPVETVPLGPVEEGPALGR